MLSSLKHKLNILNYTNKISKYMKLPSKQEAGNNSPLARPLEYQPKSKKELGPDWSKNQLKALLARTNERPFHKVKKACDWLNSYQGTSSRCWGRLASRQPGGETLPGRKTPG